jgi:hypothetical protein
MTMTNSRDDLESVSYDPTDRLLHPAVAVRTRAVLALPEQWPEHQDVESVAGKLAMLLRDRVPSVVEAVTATLDRLVAADPEVLKHLVALIREDIDVPLVGYLLRLGSAEAIEAVLSCLDVPDADDNWHLVVDTVARSPVVTDERLDRLARRGERDQRRAAATILSLRGVAPGIQILVGEFLTYSLVTDYVARGPDGIRALCGAVPFSHESDHFVAERLARRRTKTAATVFELAEHPALGGDRVAVRVLGHWDEPRSVELLLAIAEDPSRLREVRDAALESLCRIEAPEAIDVLGRAILDPEADPVTRWACESGLEAIGNHDALEKLRQVRRARRKRAAPAARSTRETA